MADKVKLGERYRDTVSGWEGIATARYEYMNGCVRIEISHKDKDGKPEAFAFDIQQIELVKGDKITPTPRATGGPRTSAPVAQR